MTWPKIEHIYITPDGIIQFILACALITTLFMYSNKAIDYNNLMKLREDYDGEFCRLRAKVDTIDAYIGGLPHS